MVTIAACKLEKKERDEIQVFTHTVNWKQSLSFYLGTSQPTSRYKNKYSNTGERRNGQVSSGEKGMEEYQEKKSLPSFICSPVNVLPSQRWQTKNIILPANKDEMGESKSDRRPQPGAVRAAVGDRRAPAPWGAARHDRPSATGLEGERRDSHAAGRPQGARAGLPRLRPNTTATGPGHDKWAGQEAAKPPPALSARAWA